jgi:hypothetical protein
MGGPFDIIYFGVPCPPEHCFHSSSCELHFVVMKATETGGGGGGGGVTKAIS